MKRLALLFAIFLCGITSGIAQEGNSYNGSLTFGIRAGYNLSNVASFIPHNESSENRSAANFGVIANIKINDNVVLRPGIYYSMKGENFPDHSEWNTSLNYLETPLLVVLQKNLTEKIGLELQAGFYFAYGVSSCYKTEVGSKLESDGKFYPVYEKVYPFKENKFKRFDWGVNLGCGINFHNFYFGAAYEVGLYSFDRPNNFNHCFMINIGYNF